MVLREKKLIFFDFLKQMHYLYRAVKKRRAARVLISPSKRICR